MRITQTDILLWQRGWQRVGSTSFNRPQHWTHPKLPGARLMTREHLDAVQNNHAQLVEALKAVRLQLLQSNNVSEYAEEAVTMANNALADATALTKGTL